jgi:hypothetical protein
VQWFCCFLGSPVVSATLFVGGPPFHCTVVIAAVLLSAVELQGMLLHSEDRTMHISPLGAVL